VGHRFAAILHGASVKLLLFAVLLVQAVLPMGELSSAAAAGALAAGVLTVTVGVGLGGIAAGATRVSPRATACSRQRFLLCLFALLGGVEGRWQNEWRDFESIDWSGDGIDPARTGQQPVAVAHSDQVAAKAVLFGPDAAIDEHETLDWLRGPRWPWRRCVGKGFVIHYTAVGVR
jgi:hypothetical protein